MEGLAVTTAAGDGSGQALAPYTLSVKLSHFTVWRHTWRKNWANCAVLTGNNTGPRTVLSSRLLHRELRSSVRESHSFLSLSADTTMASSQGTQPCKMNKTVATLVFIEAYLNDSLVFIHHSHTHKKTHRTDKKTDKPDGKPVLCQRTFQFSFSCSFLHS
jgi:hypothetical protein